MGELVMLAPRERTNQDIERFMGRSDPHGAAASPEILDATLEEMTEALSRAAVSYRDRRLEDVAAAARDIADRAHELGLNRLFRVCRHVVSLTDGHDDTALAANVARLVRLGDEAISAAWLRQDSSS